MLFSIEESDWWLIAVTATALYIVGLRLLSVGMELPDDIRSVMEEQRRRNAWKAYVLVPALLGLVLSVNLLRPEPAPAVLFLYSVTVTSIPLALLPVRDRMLRDYVARQRNPGVEMKPDRLTVAWVSCVISVAILASVIALMTTSYGQS